MKGEAGDYSVETFLKSKRLQAPLRNSALVELVTVVLPMDTRNRRILQRK